MTTSIFSWMQFNEREAQRARELVKALSEPSTLDSIGIGTIRDGFANILFPGTSTVHTRAIYLLLVPWAIQAVTAAAPKNNKQYDDKLRKIETRTIQALTDGNPSALGIIGRTAGKNLTRRPSEAYWSALGTWGICASFDSKQLTRTDVRDLVVNKRQSELQHLWRDLPTRPDDFPNKPLPILPDADQARFILGRFRESDVDTPTGQHKSLLAYLAEHPELSATKRLWDLEPDDDAIKETMFFAKGFATVIQGARLLYLRLLFDRHEQLLPKEPRSLRGDLDQLIEEWFEHMDDQHKKLVEWSKQLPEMFTHLADHQTRVSPATRHFTTKWCTSAVDDPRAAMEDAALAEMVREREHSLKGGAARLTNSSPLIAWRGQLIGEDYLNYRWNIARQLVRDCYKGLGVADA